MSTEPPIDERFAFGENWRRFLSLLDAERIAEAERSPRSLLQVTDLKDRTFLDIGSGSGLFSLAARRLGASVRSFDFDAVSVACTQELRRRYFPGDPHWVIARGSILDADFIGSLGTFDVVHSCGVLHHTGQMWAALEQAFRPAKPGGRVVVALYNHQPVLTAWWRGVKRIYHRLPAGLRLVYVTPFFCYMVIGAFAADLVRGVDPRQRYRGHGRRGMSQWYDVVDWVGGWPFETARPEDVIAFARARGMEPVMTRLVGSRHGCNEYLFARPKGSSQP